MYNTYNLFIAIYMAYLFFSVATSGLPDKDKIGIKKYDDCRLVQISWALVEDFGKKYNIVTKTIKPKKFKISKASINIHGVTNEVAKKGDDIAYVLRKFDHDLKLAKYLVSHNIEFGYKVMLNENKLINNNEHIDRLKTIEKMCIGVMTTPLLKLKTIKGYKMPKLSELYEWCFKKPFIKISTKEKLIVIFLIFDFLTNKYKIKKDS